ncbi:MAG: hemerythrin family protein [Spirochaetes bacterium]|nr:hemerythrin family protein [Spirochaetota bacterium]
MRKLEWNVQYSVGVPKLDRQHAYLFELAQRLVKHIDEKEILEKTIAELYRYVEQHFAYEESVMEKAHYDDVESHRKAHALMRTRLDLLAGQLRQGVLHRGELVAFMENWLTIHILGEDMKYIPAVAALNTD